jgi:outer membrane protein TolC
MSLDRFARTPRFGVRTFSALFSYTLTLVATLTAAPAAFAVDADTRPLSLDEAVRLAEDDSPAIAARKSAVESAEDAVAPAGALPNPQLVAGIDNLPVTTADAFNVTRDFMTMRKIGVMQDFPQREKRRSRTERAEAMAERERALLTSEQLSVREAVARAWIARASAEHRLQLLQALQPRAEAQVAAATAALSGGRGSAADGIAAKSAQASLADRISQVQREVEDARTEFARWVPEAADRPLGDSADWSDIGFDPDSLLTHVGHHRELLAYEAAEQAANADVAMARAEKRPDWSVELDYAQRGPQYSNMISLEFRIGLPIFPTHRQDATIASKEAAVTQLEAEREDAQRMHTAELKKTLAAWRSAGERVRRYEKDLLPLADDRAEAALAAYLGGRGDVQAPLTALDEAIETRLVYTELQNTYGQAWATLHFAFPGER